MFFSAKAFLVRLLKWSQKESSNQKFSDTFENAKTLYIKRQNFFLLETISEYMPKFY